MSRVFDAKHAALQAHPEDRHKAVDLFLGYLNCSEGDFRYEWNQSPEQYIFGDEKPIEPSGEDVKL